VIFFCNQRDLPRLSSSSPSLSLSLSQSLHVDICIHICTARVCVYIYIFSTHTRRNSVPARFSSISDCICILFSVWTPPHGYSGLSSPVTSVHGGAQHRQRHGSKRLRSARLDANSQEGWKARKKGTLHPKPLHPYTLNPQEDWKARKKGTLHPYTPTPHHPKP
jgi:hypothetical protein